MIQAVNLRSGMTFLQNGEIIRVLDASHHKPGKGNTVMRMKLQNVRSGAITDTTFRPDERFQRAHLETRDVQYLYNSGDAEVFMDLENYEQYEISSKQIDHEMKFIVPNAEVKVQFFESEVIGVTLPPNVELEVVETEPLIKGATAASSGKPATMETGLVVTVPDFIDRGQKVVVSTADGTYQRRA